MADEQIRVIRARREPDEFMEEGLYLPQLIIQLILSFLDGKQAARTSILSKSWYTAWSTRPILIFEEAYFRRRRNRGDEDDFRSFTSKVVQRYKDLDIKLDNFNLSMNGYNSLADELIRDSLQLGVSDLSFYLICSNYKYVLPAQVFAARSLIRLFVRGCKIDPPIDGRVLCSRLVSLSLMEVSIGDDLIRDILMGCPLIENLDLDCCECLTKINLSKLDKLAFFRVRPLHSIVIEFEDIVVGRRPNVPNFRNLTDLWLEDADISGMFFSKFSSWFPCVEFLKLSHMGGYENIQISSHSIKFLTLENGNYCLPIPVVDNLMIEMIPRFFACSHLVGALFWSCRPKIITQISDFCAPGHYSFLQLLFETLLQHGNQNCLTFTVR